MPVRGRMMPMMQEMCRQMSGDRRERKGGD